MFQPLNNYGHFFWCGFGNISTAVSLLTQCAKYCVTCQNSRKLHFMSDATLHFNQLSNDQRWDRSRLRQDSAFFFRT